ncbi:MAG TPA: M48 family metallopeptidase [Candidatus Sulfotelmatobacter sp.]|jgi:STE24 endopeptidase|nr:M48 family metallopeptidase [Candidatus Sulfotelmatobacter sp.]
MDFATAARSRSCIFLLALLLFAVAFSGSRSVATPSQSVPAAPQEAAAPASSTSTQNSTTTYHLSPEKYQRAIAYSRAGYRLYFLSVFWDLAIILFLLRSGFFAKLRDLAESRSRSHSLQAVLFVPALFALLALLNLPIRLYWHHLSLYYQQSIELWGPWLWDWTKALLLEIGLGLIVVTLLFALIRFRPRSWWLFAWLGAIPLSLFLGLIAPWYVDPLFNKFRPLQETQPQLVQSIGELARRAGIPIPPERMFLMEASAKTNAINAYVTGLGASKRIVIWDTSIKKTKPEELLFIVGHEIGHYVLGHVLKGFAYFLALLFIALFLAYRLLHWVIARWGSAWGIRGQSDWAALGALLLLFNIMNFFGEPIGNAFSRMQEHAADAYGLQLIQGFIPNANEVAAHSFQVLGEEDLDDPNPPKFIVLWLYSHPPLNDRLRFAHDFGRPSKSQTPPSPN